MEIGIQISSVKAYMQNEEDLRSSLMKFHNMGYPSAQMQWMSPDIAPEVVADAMKQAHLTSLGIQDFSHVVLANKEYYLALCRLTGGKYFCVSGIPEGYTTVEGLKEFCQILTDLQKELRKEGMVVTFHPRKQEYALYDGKTGVDFIMENTPDDFQLTLDLNHVVKAGIDAVALLEKYQGRCDIIHFKDMESMENQNHMVPVGQGCIDWKPIMEAAERTGVLYGLAEQEKWDIDAFEALKQSRDYLEALHQEILQA